ncbi:MAG: DUF4249 family protein [Bacteroidota bacterium]
MNSYKIIFCFLWISLSLSCTRDLDIPFPEHQPLLTLNTFLVEGGTPFLQVSRSFGALETITDSSIIVKDAVVELWKDGVKLSNFQYKDTLQSDTVYIEEITPGQFEYYVEETRTGVYLPTSDIEPLAAFDLVEFQASHPAYGNASAEVTITPEPEILGVELVKDSIITRDFDDGYQDKWTALKVQVNDPGEIANYYNFSAVINYWQDFGQQQGTDTLRWPQIVATEIVREADGVVYGENGPISDQEFDGQAHTIVVYLRLPGCCGYAEDLAQEDEFTYYSVDVNTFMLDASYGIFQQKRELQRYNRTEGIEGALIPTEPVSVVGNVEGGYGLIGSFNGNTRRVWVP